MATNPNQPLIPIMAQNQRRQREQQFNQLAQQVGPEALSDTLQSFRDPHNQEGRTLSEARVKIQELASSGLADTLFRVVGEPDTVQSLEGGLSGGVPPIEEGDESGLLGFFDSSEDAAMVRGGFLGERPTDQENFREQILIHELGHRLWRSATDPDFRSENAESLEFVDVEGASSLIDELFGEDKDIRDTERFAEDFQVAMSAIRRFPKVRQEQLDASDDEVLEQSIDLAMSESLTRETEPDRVQRVIDFILDQPIFERHPINREREIESVQDQATTAQDVTEVSQ